MDNFPSAIAIASFDSVCHNNNVLHRLVRPLPDGSGVQSTDRLVNVVPYRRKYTFERKQELMDFGQQILRRPLVLQPVLHFGRGFRDFCATCYHDELWLVMVNQTHPKILSRLQMGLDSAKTAMEKGQPFEIRFRFGKVIQRAYSEHLAQREREEAESSNSALQKYLTYFRYAEWEYCDLNLRFHGYGTTVNRTSAFHSLPNLEMKWDFEDIGMHEMVWNQFDADQIYPHPNLSPVGEDELREQLPGWTINGVSPLENIGDSIPEYNYNYAQAGRLYASFRKKRRPQNRSNENDGSEFQSNSSGKEPDQEEYYGEEPEGAVGYDPSSAAVYVDPAHAAIEHDFRYSGAIEPKRPSRSRQKYQDAAISQYETHNQHTIDEAESYSAVHQQPHYDTEVSGSNQRNKVVQNAHTHLSNTMKSTNSLAAAVPQADRYGHIYGNVEIRSSMAQHYQNQTQASNGTQQFDELDTQSNYIHGQSLSGYNPIKKQDSDRSSRSTIADSGYCPEEDSDRSRGGSYDYNENSFAPRLKDDHYVNYPTRNTVDDGGLVNPAFSTDVQIQDRAWQKDKHSVLKTTSRSKSSTVSKSEYMLENNNPQTKSSYVLSPKDYMDEVRAPPRQKRAVTSSGTPKIAESFI